MAGGDDAGRHAAERHDRGTNPFLILLFVPVIAVAGFLVAILILPPIAGAAFGIDRVDAKLTALGADFTHIPKFPERSTIYAADGKTILATLYLDNREIVGLDRISKLARKAVLAIEDAEFYTHGALDWPAVVRALLTNVAAGDVEQGASTITTQLVKNAITGDTSTTFQRKFQELALALRVEQAYTKDEILALYLNDVYLGNGVYGIGTAAEFYFDVPAKKLGLNQGATLAAMLKAPEYYDPIDHPVKTRKRRNLVLDRMAELGLVPQDKIDRAKDQPVIVVPDGPARLEHPPFFVSYIRDQIIENVDGEFDAFGRSEKQRQRRLYEGGLDIYTTLEPGWQAAAQAVANEPYRVGAANPNYEQTPDTAIVSVENETGAIRTMLSGRNYAHDRLNLANSHRQPGSSFKPFTLVAAFREGIPAGSVFSTKSPLFLPEWTGNDCSCVSNAEGAGDGGYRNLWEATADSINVVFAQLILEVGPEAVVEAAHDMGITTELPAVPSLTLGTVDVTPIEMASAYQTLANEGKHCVPFTVDHVMVDDELFYQHEPRCKQVVEPEIANLVTAMIQGGVQHGTGTAAALSPWPVAGKTGTTQDYSNVWFVGFTRQVSTAVWVGFPGTPDSLELYFGQSVFGGTIAAPIWHDYMARIMTGMPAEGFPAPPAPATATIPDVVGLKSEKAQNKLVAADFTPTIELVDDPAPKGTVVAQTPAGGTGAELGSLVTLQVSNGVAPIAKVPPVVGMTEAEARKVLKRAGFPVEIVFVETEDPSAFGVVLQQTPGGNVKAEVGTTVMLKVGVEPGGGEGRGGGDGGRSSAVVSRRAWP